MKFGPLCMNISLLFVAFSVTSASFCSDGKDVIQRTKPNGGLHHWVLPVFGGFLGYKYPMMRRSIQNMLINTQQKMGLGSNFRHPNLVKTEAEAWSGIAMKIGFSAGCVADIFNLKSKTRTA